MNFNEVSNEKINSEDEVIKTMDNFANRIPIMIERLEIINKGIKVEPLSKLILEINESSKILFNLGKDILRYDKELVEKNQKKYMSEFETITNLAKKSLYRKNDLYDYLDKILLVLVIFTILFNLGIGYYYKKSLDKVNEKTSRIHNILLKEEKYWIDKENFQVYTEHVKK
ncbi:hypothetical protein [uncultured Fusobacterium sp.]|uniref:hypothetical protein n=1 Tax=uncultured Fusobacterium sp. TaxID=159267 RepID=UPI002592EDAE|nr:hypothetical protein [uncultured Fusobacterium sp.]